MEKDTIKEAFFKVKEDIDFLNNELSFLRSEITQINGFLRDISDDLSTLKLHKIAQEPSFPVENKTTTVTTDTTTVPVNTTGNTTVPWEIGGLKYPNLGISTGNQGASTDRQTDRQTDTSTHNLGISSNNSDFPDSTKTPFNSPDFSRSSIEENIQDASQILDSLDKIKREIRLKFKRVTQQEMLVFSTIYQLEEQDPDSVTYKTIAQKLHLSQSSIRDYVGRMIDKGIPIKKQKINNRKLILAISGDLKRIATLSTIIKLRDL
ncbi:HTH domain-containing protein [Candidatus Pacearchaeota archaeon]|nr:HTH domain-containing protein [Candidatus Pacearchaeota archaeon]